MLTVESGNNSASVIPSGKGQSGLLSVNHVIPCCAELGPGEGQKSLKKPDVLETCTSVACTGCAS